MQKLEQTWRWYGPDDPVNLQDIKQAGATGIVTALHHIPHGVAWPKSEIVKRKKEIEEKGLNWSAVESLPVHEAIKTGAGDREQFLKNYVISLNNLAECGIKTICYNFMPVLDWTRTELRYKLANGARALYFNWVDLAVFDIFILKREKAKEDYNKDTLARARQQYASTSSKNLEKLQNNILMGIPGEGDVSLSDLRENIAVYKEIGEKQLRENLFYFLNYIADICEEKGIRMTLHPDDPPYPILGLPRIARNLDDYEFILKGVDQDFNGICFCSGSLGAGKENDIPEMFSKLKKRVYFLHLRNVNLDAKRNFYEADHLEGATDMVALMTLIVEENQKRKHPLPFRPDHGHQLLDDIGKKTNPGYSAIGRLKGLAELRGMEKALLERKW